MANIHLLDRSVAELIAAGEVVDRPASIVKELVENSLDAGARRITVEVKNGGVTLLRVTDDGCGIAREDIPTAFLRHATSKVLSAEDLEAITTLGFRGEALPSIAAVSRVEVLSRVPGEVLGTRFLIEGSERSALEDAGCPAGTSVTVRDVFYNTPARMKFLKKDVSEANAVAAYLDRLALANPGVSFRFVRDGQVRLLTPGDGNLLSAVRLVCGAEVAAGMLPVSYESGAIFVGGYLSRPSVFRSTRTLQQFFLNTRYVRSKTLSSAVEESFKNRLMTGRFPACVLNLTVPAGSVDVNVHPAKLEVRFSDEKSVYQAVYGACMAALREYETGGRPGTPSAQKKLTPFDLSDFDYSGRQNSFSELRTLSGTFASGQPLLVRDDSSGTIWKRPANPPGSMEPEPAELPRPCPAPNHRDPADLDVGERPTKNAPEVERTKEPDCPPYRVLGEVFETYIIAEQAGELVLVDKHAAHERYLYNRIRDLDPGEGRQTLLSAVTVVLSREEQAAITENLETLSRMGFLVEDFGDRTLLVREVPLVLAGYDLTELLSQVAKKLLSVKNAPTPDLFDELLYSVSCRAAVMAGKGSKTPELLELARMALGKDGVRFCPHGRPVAVRLSRREVEKMFGRLG